ncbi:MAG: toll/interleukin-1 receptor domain-containing protein [Clostridia bacterium]|nr:toll/interleukin-1 receptor domain-containing protein [Clostridia bacterium]
MADNLQGRQSEGYAFISYSSKNAAEADSVRVMFKKNGIKMWMAPYDIPAGGKYAGEITRALKNCSCLVLLLTDAAQQSEWVDKEVERAIGYKKTIIPVQLEDLTLNDSFEYYLGNCQIIPVKTVNENSAEIQKVIRAVKTFVDKEEGEKPEEVKSGVKDPVAILIEGAKKSYGDEDYITAEELLRQALRLDNYNKEAYSLLQIVLSKRMRF